jgi:hypothetical protein
MEVGKDWSRGIAINCVVGMNTNEPPFVPRGDLEDLVRMRSNIAPAPVLANFHGRSFVNPLHGSDDEFCRFIAKKTGR